VYSTGSIDDGEFESRRTRLTPEDGRYWPLFRYSLTSFPRQSPVGPSIGGRGRWHSREARSIRLAGVRSEHELVFSEAHNDRPRCRPKESNINSEDFKSPRLSSPA